ncbi:MAG: ATP-binding cassette domain-containing protein [Pseudomonadota bacterium]
MSAEPASGGDEPLLSARDVRFRWPGAEQDLLSIDTFSLAYGERLFLHGSSGSGKSSLLALLGGVARPREGEIRLLGKPLQALRQKQADRLRADHIGFVFQLFNLVPYLGALQNVMLPCSFSTRRREQLQAEGVSVEAEARRLLERLELADEPLLQRAVTDLSIGQQQRVAVARALIGAPELLIADEPTSALDEGTRERFLELLFGECDVRGTAVLLVSHDVRVGALFDRRLALSDLNMARTA